MYQKRANWIKPITPTIDLHVTYLYNKLFEYIIQQTDNENTQTYQR